MKNNVISLQAVRDQKESCIGRECLDFCNILTCKATIKNLLAILNNLEICEGCQYISEANIRRWIGMIKIMAKEFPLSR